MNNARILIVEDEAIASRDLHGRLTKLGYTPVGATSRGDQAVAFGGTVASRRGADGHSIARRNGRSGGGRGDPVEVPVARRFRHGERRRTPR